MKLIVKLIIVSIQLLVVLSLNAQKNDSVSGIETPKQIQLVVEGDSVTLHIAEIDQLVKALSTEPDVVQKYTPLLPSIVAIIVVIISSWFSTRNVRKQIEAEKANQEINWERQKELFLGQINAQTDAQTEGNKATLRQVRANNISNARINYMQDLRNLIVDFLGFAVAVNYNLRKVIELNDSDVQAAKELYEEQINKMIEVQKTGLKIKLFLNIKEGNHKQLDELIDQYEKIALNVKEAEKSDNLTEEIKTVSRIILKDVWEQAKKEQG